MSDEKQCMVCGNLGEHAECLAEMATLEAIHKDEKISKPKPSELTEEQKAGNKLFCDVHALVKDKNWMDAMSTLANFQALVFNATMKEQEERELVTLKLDIPDEPEYAGVKELAELFANYSIGDANKYSQVMLNAIELHTKLLVKENTVDNLGIKLPGDVETPKE